MSTQGGDLGYDDSGRLVTSEILCQNRFYISNGPAEVIHVPRISLEAAGVNLQCNLHCD